MTGKTRDAIATLLAAMALAGIAWVGMFSGGVPAFVRPMPALTFIPALLLSGRGLSWLAVLIPTIFFLVWNPGLLHGKGRLPVRSVVLFGLATILSLVDFVESWQYGVKYQGIRYTYAVCAANMFWVVLLTVVFFLVRRAAPSFRNNLLANWLLFAWLAWYAFPTMGELP